MSIAYYSSAWPMKKAFLLFCQIASSRLELSLAHFLPENEWLPDGRRVSPLKYNNGCLELQSAWIWRLKGENLFCLLDEGCADGEGWWRSPTPTVSHTLVWQDKWQLQSATSKNTTSLWPWQPSWRSLSRICCQSSGSKRTCRLRKVPVEGCWGLYFTTQI